MTGSGSWCWWAGRVFTAWTRATSQQADCCRPTCRRGSAGRETLPTEHSTVWSPTTPVTADQTGQSAGHREAGPRSQRRRCRMTSAAADCSIPATRSSLHRGTGRHGRSRAGSARLTHTPASQHARARTSSQHTEFLTIDIDYYHTRKWNSIGQLSLASLWGR